MRIKTTLFLFTLPSLLLLGGCATAPKVQYINTGNDPSMVALNQIAEKSERSTEILAEIQAAQADSSITLQGARLAMQSEMATPAGWGKLTSVSYQGPFDKIIYQLATRSSYQYFEEGIRPANLKVVNIDMVNKTLIQILRNVAAQSPSSVQIIVNPTSRSVIVKYQAGR